MSPELLERPTAERAQRRQTPGSAPLAAGDYTVHGSGTGNSRRGDGIREAVRSPRSPLARAGKGSGLHVIRNVMAPLVRSGKDGRVESVHPDALPCQVPKPIAIPPSRTIDFTSERAVDRFIKRVLETRSMLADHERWRRRTFPQLAGGAQAQATMQGPESNPATSSVAMVPFDQASKRGIEPGPQFTVTPGASAVTLGPSALPAQGYLRMVEIDVQTKTAGTGGGVEVSEDSPFNIFNVLRFQDTNGNQLDDLPGYPLYLDNVYGGYAGAPDPRVDDFFKNTPETLPGVSFSMYITRELAPNAFGAIANMSASQSYKLTLRIATAAEFFKKAPATTNPELLVTVWMHFWQLPDDMDMLHRPQVQTPPFHGTTQYRWFSPENSTTTNYLLNITQTGNEIRNIVLIGRNTAKRNFECFPEPFQFRWDTELLLIAGQRQLRKIARELTNDQVNAIETGVIPLPFNFGEGRFVGGSGLNSWLPTVTATRLQITGTAAKSSLTDVMVNDVSVAETNPALRPVTPGPGGYVAPVAPRLAPTG